MENTDKQGIPDADLATFDEKSEQKKEMASVIDEGKTIDWENKEKVCAQLTQLMPNLEEWACMVVCKKWAVVRARGQWYTLRLPLYTLRLPLRGS
jgi:hypothetical protein